MVDLLGEKMRYQEEYKGQIEGLKKRVKEYEFLFDKISGTDAEFPYQCCSCGTWTTAWAEDYLRGGINPSTKRRYYQRCDCCPLCAIQGTVREDAIDDGKNPDIEVMRVAIETLDQGGEPCTNCMENHNNLLDSKIETAIIELAGLEGFTEDVVHGMQYANPKDISELVYFRRTEDVDKYGRRVWVPRVESDNWQPSILNTDTRRSWCSKEDWYSLILSD
jgi:hypothetical protein